MQIKIIKWRIEYAKELANILSNKNILNNLRDGLPYPYTESDAAEYINAMISADKENTFAFAIAVDDKVIGSIGAFRQENIHKKYFMGARQQNFSNRCMHIKSKKMKKCRFYIYQQKQNAKNSLIINVLEVIYY